MSPLMRCRSCGGVYDPDQPGGYYHACPPVTRPDGTFRERVDKRDENIEQDPKTLKVRIRKEGKGREPVVEGP